MNLYQKVKLLSDKYSADGLRVGDIGRIMEIYPDDFYEVDFYYSNGTTIAMFAFPACELAPIAENEGIVRDMEAE